MATMKFSSENLSNFDGDCSCGHPMNHLWVCFKGRVYEEVSRSGTVRISAPIGVCLGKEGNCKCISNEPVKDGNGHENNAN